MKLSELPREFLGFNDRSPSPFHAASSVAQLLRDAGFSSVSEAEPWSNLDPGGRYFFTRGGSSIVAFVLPQECYDDGPCFAIIGAHTDSPCFKVKPVSNVPARHGYLQVGVECYGGGLWHTWFDRDLGVAGRVVVRSKDTDKVEFRMVHISKPVFRIPNLAIHLNPDIRTKGFQVNKETHTVPILATEQAASDLLNSEAPSAGETATKDAPGKTTAKPRHAPLLLTVLARELGVDADEIIDVDLCLTDTQPCAIGGACDEFIFAPRLDNLASCFTATKALIRSLDSSCSDGVVRMVALFDHEEVGSSSANGADSPLVADTMQRLFRQASDIYGWRSLEYQVAVRRSFLISADMAHAIHPNYAGKHEAQHRPTMGSGLVIKTNQNQRYATSGVTGYIVREIARRAGNLPIQEFVVPNDSPCGSTIGPIVSSNTGLRTVDVGQPQLSMHSVREMCHAGDMVHTEQVFHAFYTSFAEVDNEISKTAEILDRS